MESVEEIYNDILKKPLEVVEIFNDFFKEEFVDFQCSKTLDDIKRVGLTDRQAIKNYILGEASSILVWFPHVTITNENDKSVDIEDLYAKILIDLDGKMVGRFMLNRATYTTLHLENSYMHSHVSRIPTGNFAEFQTPCTGSGPINSTIASLNAGFDEELWNLFCLELSKYVTVESIKGIPYHRLEGLRRGGDNISSISSEYQRATYNSWGCYPSDIENFDFANVLLGFYSHLIKVYDFKFNYINNSYYIAEPSLDIILKISKEFIKWYNRMYRRSIFTATQDQLIVGRILLECVLDKGKLYRLGGSTDRASLRYYVGQYMCTFKGRAITISISDLDTEENPDIHPITILNPPIVFYIITKLLDTVNYHYGNTKQRNITDKKVRYV